MNPIAIAFLGVSVIALLVVPRQWAPLALIAGACYMTLGTAINLGPLTFTVIRILIAVGVLRVILRSECIAGGMQGLDWLMAAWALWACLSSAFHEPLPGALIFRLGIVYNACGIYFLARIFCRSVDDGLRLTRILALLLIPLAAEMVYEQVAQHNLFSILGGVHEVPDFREGRLRAQGPFAHPILAGTVGAVSLPLMMAVWPYYRISSGLGVIACLVMVMASASSGPAMSAIFAIAAVSLWPCRGHLKAFRRIAVCGWLVLAAVMKAPVYYLIARIDVVGGSTGWYRARLIESAVDHLSEWWLAGTDLTAHWMQTGVVGNQADIVNHYLQMGVWGGLPLMFLFVAILVKAFSKVGLALQAEAGLDQREQFVVWSFGASLVAHAATWMSVSYFDQSVVFLYLTLAAIGSGGTVDTTAAVHLDRLNSVHPVRKIVLSRGPAATPATGLPEPSMSGRISRARKLRC